MEAAVAEGLAARLRPLPLFAGVPTEVLAEVAASARQRVVPPGEVLCTAGEAGDTFYLITAGAVNVFAASPRGEEWLAQLGPGEWFGEMALITGEPRSATVVALAETMLIILERTSFQELLRRSPSVAMAISDVLSRRLRAHLLAGPRQPRPRFVVALCAGPAAAQTRLLLNVAAALRHEGQSLVTLVDWAGNQLRAALAEGRWEGLHVVDDRDVDIALLRAAQQLLIVVVAANDARAAALAREAERVWVLGARDRTPALPAELSRPASVTWLGRAGRDTRAPDTVTFEADAFERNEVVRTDPHSAAASGLRRFARQTLGRRIGLVLSAGGAKGLAHLGALRCFERDGLEFDLIAGTSMGGIIGAAIALGRTSTELIHVFHDLTDNLRRRLIDVWVPEQSVLRGDKKLSFLYRTVGEVQIEDLPLPFWCVAGDLVSGREVVFGRGPLCQALDATSAMPGVFPPVVLGEQVLVDGWIVNSLPADVLRREGAGIVLAVNVSAGASTRSSFHRGLLGGANGWRDRLRRLMNPSIVRIAMGAVEVGARERTLANLALVDACAEPDLSEFSTTDFRRMPELVELGEAAAEEAMPAIRAALRRGAS